MKNNLKKIIISAVILVLLLIILLPKLLSSSSVKNSNLAGNKLDQIISVKAYIIKPETVDNKVLTTGTILANEEVELKSEVAGKITKILFNEGSYVNKGDLLVKINDADLQAQLRRAESKVKLAEEKEFRQRQLRDGNLISQEEYDNTVSELNVNKADYDLIKAQIDKTEIRAPFSGTIGLRSVSEGSYLTTATVIATFQNLNIIKVDFSIPEKYSTSVKKGDELDFRISGSATVFKAKIYAIEPKIDPGTRTLKIRAICNSNYSELIPGAFANVELSLKKINDAILVPSVAIVPELKGQKVYLYKNGVVAQQNVEIGIREETSIQIISGLNAGDTVITSGILQIKPMSKVTISEFVK
ncbi:MAG: efflux RND transporter periplasmic adaptor subunit [Ignavibacterium sp.]|jgi:membrane fusion protein (multidrug efflux system)|nr:MAG: efflux RND transporter periplasmic adaptor subunit [Ignavibacterium sp.]MDD5606997.1 efflux RND transporter periplasmic adaptor subunit [Ignavibacterium sp.]MDX9713421.1 efflux RND transporter periplasmic adaptor subunit [Ignavibacteriaceae bacterium]GIK21630.1 MAG: MexH family multidrug efflux RND transporter periplasmic adaptor subunit [Ignavibacteriota bacterium]